MEVYQCGSLVTTAWRDRVADRGEGLQIRKVAANILNQLRTADKGWCSSLGLGCGDNNSL
jgi:hypothetical protein